MHIMNHNANAAYISFTYLAVVYRNEDETFEEFEARVEESMNEAQEVSHPYALNDAEVEFLEVR